MPETIMESIFKVIEEMKTKWIIKDFVIAGAIGALYYLPPDALRTSDLDVAYLDTTEEKDIMVISVTPIWDYLTKIKKYPIQGQHILVEGFPVEFITVIKGLEREAFDNARLVSYHNCLVKISRPEHIIANYVQANRPKDRTKVALFLKHVPVDMNYLESILKRHGLFERFQENKKRGLYE